MSHIIRLELPDAFFKRRWDHIYFYGSGCALPDRNKLVESSLIAQFKTPCTVNSDILGAARGLLIHEPGLACILRTGSNSCLYDGNDIVKNVNGWGFILGDEGSNAHIGKLFISDLLKDLAPHELVRAFYERYQFTEQMLMDGIYDAKVPSQSIAEYAFFLKDYISEPYVYNLVYNSFMSFFQRNISAYDYKDKPINFVGSTCDMFADVLRKVAADFGATIGKIEKNSMRGLVTFHANNDKR
jgi:N-acetylglucosamine kinase-like BadF-type ATPase